MYISEWRSSVQICSSLTLYRELKCTFDRADYLQVLENRNIRNVIAKLRLLSHNCSLRLGDIDREDEYHFISICPFYNNIRNTHILRYFGTRPSMFKFVQLLNETSKHVLVQLSLGFQTERRTP